MKKLSISILFFTMMILSCTESDDNLNPITDNQSNLLNGEIKVKVRECLDPYCYETRYLPYVEVSLQRDDSDVFYRTGVSDESGEVTFPSINVSPLTVFAIHDKKEFELRVSLGKDQISHVDILYSPFCDLEGSSLVNCSNKIFPGKMHLGMQSSYRLYKTNEQQLNDDRSFYYTGDTMVLTVEDKLDENKWIVREEFLRPIPDSVFEYIIQTETRLCVWEINEDHFKIYPLTGQEPSNFSLFFTGDNKTYEIPFSVDGDDTCDMDLWFPINCNISSTNLIRDAEFNGIKYEDDLIYNFRSGIDLPLLGLIYSKEEGIVHSFKFGNQRETHAYGFDLIDN